LGVERSKQVNYSGLTGKKSHKRSILIVSHMVLSRIVGYVENKINGYNYRFSHFKDLGIYFLDKPSINFFNSLLTLDATSPSLLVSVKIII
jgi:hypothetical protein